MISAFQRINLYLYHDFNKTAFLFLKIPANNLTFKELLLINSLLLKCFILV